MYVTKNLLQLTKSGLKFFKKVQAKQKWVLYSVIKEDSANAFKIPSLPENFGWNLIKEKYKLQWFEGDVSPNVYWVCLYK